MVDFPDLDDDYCDCILCPPGRAAKPKPTTRRVLLQHLYEKHDRVFHDARWITRAEASAVHDVLHEVLT